MECSPPTDRLNPCPENTAPINEECTEANRTDREQARRNPFRRRFDRITLGFWLGGLALGTGGCLFGASLPCRYPVAGVISRHGNSPSFIRCRANGVGNRALARPAARTRVPTRNGPR